MSGAAAPEKKNNSKSRVFRRQTRIYRRGTLMFIEGETGSTMFIVRTGKVRILKQQGDRCIELAVLGPGSVLGELSLLDNQPRSATAQVVEDTTVTVIDRNLLDRTMNSIPQWLAGVIKIVVKRLRDTMKRSADDMVNNSIGGVIKILLSMSVSEGRKESEGTLLSILRAKEFISNIIGIGETETERVFLHLILKEMIVIRKDTKGEEFLILKDVEILRQYLNFLRAKQLGGSLPGADLDKGALNLIRKILKAGEKNARQVKNNIYKVGLNQVALEQSRGKDSHHIDPDILDRLIGRKILILDTEKSKTPHGVHKNSIFIYNKQTLQTILSLHDLMPIFREEVHF